MARSLARAATARTDEMSQKCVTVAWATVRQDVEPHGCDNSYPDKPPTCAFESKLNFPFIDSKGNFTATTKINWNSQNSSIESFLMEMRALMIKPEYKKNKQPEENLTY